MTDFPDLKFRALVNFPSNAFGGTGTDVRKQNGNFFVDLDFADFAPPVDGINDPTHENVLLWNDITNQYVLVPISVVGSGGSVTEAPIDGQQYGRQSLNWTPIAIRTPSDSIPLTDGIAAPGTASEFSRGDHVHPTDTSRAAVTYVDAQDALKAPLASPALTGNPTAPTPTAGDNDTSIATTAFVSTAITNGAIPTAATVAPLMDGVAAVGATAKYAKEDHIHPSDTSRQAADADLTAIAALAGTGLARRTATTPTWSVGTAVANSELATMAAFTFKGNNSGSAATPADVDIAALTTKASPAGGDYLLVSDQAASGAWKKVAISTMPGASGGVPEAPNDGQQYGRQNLGWTAITGVAPSNAAPAMNGAASAGASLLYSRGDHVHPIDTSRQPLDAELTAIAGLVSGADLLPYFTGSGTASLATFTAFARSLVDDADAATARGTLGLTAAATATPAALTKTDDANVTLTLGGTPATALLQASSITVGWSGTLAAARGGFGADVSAQSGVPLFATGAATFTGTTGTGNFVRATDPALAGNPTAPTPTAGDNDTSIATTAFVQSALASSGAGKNRLINGRFNVSQITGAAPASAASYTYGPDMWRMLIESGLVNMYALRNDFTATFNTNGLVQSPTANLKFGALQVIELANMRDLAGVAATLSASLFVNPSAVTNVKMAILQWTGTANAVTNPISAWNAAGTNPTLAANWAYVNAPANLGVTGTPTKFSVTGTVGVTAKNLAVMIWCDSKTAAAGENVFMTDVQLEAGPVATAFEFRQYNIELELCQRYWRKTATGTGVAVTVNIARMVVNHPNMLAPPAASVSGVMVLSDYITALFAQSAGAVSVWQNSVNEGQYQFANFTGLTVGRWHTFDISSAQLQLDARL